MGARHQLKRQSRAAFLFGLGMAAMAPALVVGCRHHDDDDATTVATEDGGSAALAPAAVPTDRLAPKELLESKTVVFGIALPVGLRVVVNTSNARMDITGPGEQDQVTRYFQARVKGGKLFPGAHASDFRGVAAPSAPGRLLDIHVEQDHALTDVIMKDVTPKDAAVLPPAEAYRLTGTTPDGKLADPNHLQ
jgi:hypothetical protein